MEAESFFARWAKRNEEAGAEKRESATANRQEPAPPTLDEVSLLTADSDFTRFVAPGVDETIRRGAMKKLFADPRFNVMDGLDVYIEDYNTFTPIPAAMLAALNHAKGLLMQEDSEADSKDTPEEPEDSFPEDQTTDDDPVQGM